MASDTRPSSRRMDDATRQALPLVKVIKNLKSFIRKDFGGQDPIEVIRNKILQKAAKEGRIITDAGATWAATFANEIATEQVEGCRERTRSNIDELERRINILSSQMHSNNITDIGFRNTARNLLTGTSTPPQPIL